VFFVAGCQLLVARCNIFFSAFVFYGIIVQFILSELEGSHSWAVCLYLSFF
jgi:hypothetical protein